MADDEPETGSSQDGKSWFGRHQQAAWIAAGASIVVALITTLVPVLGSAGEEKVAGPSVAGPGSTPITMPITMPITVPVTVPVTVRTTVQNTVKTMAPTPPTASRPAETPPSSTAGTVLWQGSLVLDTDAKDLDAVPPVLGGYYDSDIYMLLGHQMSGTTGTVISRWTKRSPSLPGYRDCASTIGPEGGVQQQQLSKSTVLCLQTNEGNIARLRVTALPDNEYGIGHRAVFDVAIWSGT